MYSLGKSLCTQEILYQFQIVSQTGSMIKPPLKVVCRV